MYAYGMHAPAHVLMSGNASLNGANRLYTAHGKCMFIHIVEERESASEEIPVRFVEYISCPFPTVVSSSPSGQPLQNAQTSNESHFLDTGWVSV